MQSRRPTIPESHRDLLESTSLTHVATLGPHGEPQSNPVWSDPDGEHVRFSQTKTHQKYCNVHRDPRIVLSIVDLGDPFRDLEIGCVVERPEKDPDFASINAMAKKYLGVNGCQIHRPSDEREVVLVRPQHTTKMNG